MGSSATAQITGETLIPELLRTMPGTRRIFDKYGLKGCGGAQGPHESLRIFARAHEVNLQILISELQEAHVPSSTCEPDQDVRATLTDVIYRRFFLAAVLFLLTVGASWGASILWTIGTAGKFGAASTFDIQAHAQAQVFGWMGLAIMGFAYQAFPRFWHTELCNARRANWSFWSMTAGVLCSGIGIYTASWAAFALPLTALGGCLELIAVALFSFELLATYRRSGKAFEPYMAYVFVAAFWFLLGTLLNLIYSVALVSSVKYLPMGSIAFWAQSPMRDVQFHGLGITIILGVSLRTLPHIFGVQRLSDRFAWAALCALTLSVAAETALSLAGKPAHWSVALTLLVVAAAAVSQFKLWRKFPDGDRSDKFIKAGWVWLLISLGMLLVAGVNMQLWGLGPTHAYMGAIRHAITVGFISLMIMGYAAKVVATLNGLNTRTLTPLIASFLLVNVGCAIRVFGQVLTDTQPHAFPIIAVSGCLESVGMAIWGWHIAMIILMGQRAIAAKPATPAPDKITADMIVADVLDWFPHTQSVFVDFGFRPITNPLMRRTVARQVTVRQACKLHDINADDFVGVLNTCVQPRQCSGSCALGQCGADAD